MGKDVIVALDFDSKEKTLAFLDRFTEEKPFVKIGMELFYAEGPSIVREIRARGHKIFLDLKLHDIPNTVKKAMAALSALDVDIVNLHAAGTAAMMTAALEGLTRPDGTRPLLIAVTQLTSTEQERMERELWIEKPLAEVVMHYAENAAQDAKTNLTEAHAPDKKNHSEIRIFKKVNVIDMETPLPGSWMGGGHNLVHYLAAFPDSLASGAVSGWIMPWT